MPTFDEGLQKVFGLDLEKASHAELYNAREKTTNKEDQNKLATAEHKAFAREATAENPWMAIPISLAIPLYEAAKATGILEGRSDASIENITEAYKGVYQGLTK